MKYFLWTLATLITIFAIFQANIAQAATPITFPVNGGTGSSTLTGILLGNGKNPVNSLVIGSGCTLVSLTLSCTGTGGTGSFPFTPTSYGVSTSTTIGFTNGFISTASSTVTGLLTLATTTGILLDKGGAVYNVKAYGAKCDGTTDDTSAIQAAVNSAEIASATTTATGGTIYFPTGQCLVSSPITITGSNINLVGAGISITNPGETNGSFLGQPLSSLLPSSGFPANNYVVSWGTTNHVISGGGIDNLAIDGRLILGVVSNVGGIHLASTAFLMFNSFSIQQMSGDGILVDQANCAYAFCTTSQDWFTNFTIMNVNGASGIAFGNINATDYYISNFWMSKAGSIGIDTSASNGGNFYSLYINNGTIDSSSNEGMYLATGETHVADVNVTNSHGWGLEVNDTNTAGYISDIHDSIFRDNGHINGCCGNVIVDSGSTGYHFYDDFAGGVNYTTEAGFDFAGGLNTNNNLIDETDYAKQNVGNFVFGSGGNTSTTTANTVANIQPYGGPTSIGTSTLISTLFVQGTSSSPTADLFDLASSTGTKLLTVLNTGFTGIGVGTPVFPLEVFNTNLSTQLALTGGSLTSPGLEFLTTLGGGGRRNWEVSTENPNIGDFNILVSTATGGNPQTGTSVLYATSGGLVGLSTTSPKSTLSVSGNASIGADYNTAAPVNGLSVEGQVGIGTQSPDQALTVIGSFHAKADNSYIGVDDNVNPRVGFTKKAGAGPFLAYGNGQTFNIEMANANDIVAGDSFTTRLTIDTSGNIGIASSTPGTLLSLGVSGNASGINFSLATSTFENAGGINLTTGCFSINNVCVGGSTGTSLGYTAWGGSSATTYGTTTIASTTPFWAQGGIFASSTSATPTLAVTQSGTGAAAIFTGGNVGIGTTSPYTLFDIQSSKTGDDTPALVIDGSATANGNADLALTRATGGTGEANIDFNNGSTNVWQLGIQNTGANTGDFELWDGLNNPIFTIQRSTNNVSFGTTTPAANDFVTIATSSEPQFTLGDGTANLMSDFRNVGNMLYVATSAPFLNNGATSTVSMFNFNEVTGALAFAENATTSFNGSLNLTTTSGTALKVNDGFGSNILTVSTASTTSGYLLLSLSSATSTGPLFAVDQYGHVSASSTTPVLSSCGTTPSITADSSDFSGTITVGSVAATACTLTFGTAHTTGTHCVISEQTGSVVNVSTYTESLSGFTYSQTGLTSDKLDYVCTGS